MLLLKKEQFPCKNVGITVLFEKIVQFVLCIIFGNVKLFVCGGGSPNMLQCIILGWWGGVPKQWLIVLPNY